MGDKDRSYDDVWLPTLSERTLTSPLRWRKVRKACRVKGVLDRDLFDEETSDEQLDRIFAVMALSPQHTFQVLTKRPERMRSYLTDEFRLPRISVAMGFAVARQSHRHFARGAAVTRGWSDGVGWPLPNVWLGVSVEDQATADERIPLLLQTPAALRWVSYEPALGPVDLRPAWFRAQRGCDGLHSGDGSPGCPREEHHHHDEFCGPRLDWLVVGGESGPGARPCDVEWISSAVRQCKGAGVPAFVKQMGSNARARFSDSENWPCEGSGTVCADDSRPWYLKFRRPSGGDPSEWPEGLRVREFPAPKGATGGATS